MTVHLNSFIEKDSWGLKVEKIGERKPRKGQNRIKTGQKREAWRSREKFKAVAVGRARKTEQNAKRMAKNVNAVRSYSNFSRKKKGKGPEMPFLQSYKDMGQG
uniref:Uncharacterized protein n=1 Tax=Tanacetum cinerariifolium TaxID=118510 RepID=A0A6L2N171_TANCI|nr:hypothetical protein [Tanacetum cinerariifolium]